MNMFMLYLIFQADSIRSVSAIAAGLFLVIGILILFHRSVESYDEIWTKTLKNCIIVGGCFLAICVLVPSTKNLILITGIHTLTTNETVARLGEKGATVFESLLDKYISETEKYSRHD